MKMTASDLKKYIISLITQTKGKSRIICSIFSVLLGLSGILLVILAVSLGSILGAITSIIGFPVLVLAPFYFNHFFRDMLKGVADKKVRRNERIRQVEKYNSLPFRHTFRGMAFYITGFILMVTILLGVFTYEYSVLFEIAVIIPMMFLMKRGYSWIFVFAILWWTIEKGLQLYTAPSSSTIVSILVWWLVVSYIYLQAFKVEKMHNKLVPENDKPWQKDLLKAFSLFVVLAVVVFTFAFNLV